MSQFWIGVDLDGTLALYDYWRGPSHIGEPIGPMVDRVKQWLKDGQQVRIVTARVSPEKGVEATSAIVAINAWTLKHLGQVLPITNCKDTNMTELWDDRARQVYPNTGIPVI